MVLAHSGVVKMKSRPDVGTDARRFSLDMNDASHRLSLAIAMLFYLKAREYEYQAEENKKARKSLRITKHW